MCALYDISGNIEEMQEIMSYVQEKYTGTPIAKGQIYPKAIAPVLLEEDGQIQARPMMWGFPLEGKKSVNFNARSETSFGIPMFRRARPMIIPTTGFYEWTGEKGHKQRFMFCDPDSQLTFIAGLWDDFEDRKDGLYPVRFTMLTTNPSRSYAEYHRREPVVMRWEDCQKWMHKRSGELLKHTPFRLEAREA